MSKYTTEVRYICEMHAPDTNIRGDLFQIQNGAYNVTQIIDKSWDKIFNFDFPIWDENYRSVLCKKILKHYYTREIGFETFELWRLKLDTKMNEIMPYYNQLYESTTYKYNPLFDVDYYRTFNGKDDGTNGKNSQSNAVNDSSNTLSTENKTGSSGKNKRKNKFSDTPQGGLIGIENDEYLTNATIEENEGENSTTQNGRNVNLINGRNSVNSSEAGNFTTTKDYVEHIAGKYPGISYGKAIKEYRDNLINIDNLIIDELKDLFMLLW